ncbi:hypothetical protein A2619_02605 [candidate division WWE3 bacterium RIFOXYD1_FULL_39_9]|uniref:Uncharacterized protein n=1 Tax=candidate division WWE3 bacterium RIFOXYD1_FULL_39_9 TaxID=1802649 RepID=A0A1F4X930_UNCKA|nr:MAG: hypothetical protein A2619_02605 [candidate division WWE3 bacterium RIFOXYD1_FULL_39_9]
MKLVKGNKTLDIDESELDKIIAGFKRTEIDLGTGDGKFVYKSAQRNPEILYIGIDPSEKQLEIYAKRTARKRLKNALFVLGSAEILPNELTGKADKLNIILPWGSLLQLVAKPTQDELKKIKGLLKPHSELIIVFGYSPELEPSEAKRLDLPEITERYIKADVLPEFIKCGFEITKLEKLQSHQLEEFDSTWSKKIRLTSSRPLFIMQAILN